MKSIAEVMSDVMSDNRISLRKFAHTFEMGYGEVWAIRNGTRVPSREQLIQMSEVYPAFKDYIPDDEPIETTAPETPEQQDPEQPEEEKKEPVESKPKKKTKKHTGSSLTPFGKNLSKILKQKHMSVKDLAKATGINYSILGNIKYGNTKLSAERAQIIAYALGVDVETLVPEFKVEEPMVLPWSGKEISMDTNEEPDKKVTLGKKKNRARLQHVMLSQHDTCMVFVLEDGSVMMTEVSGCVLYIEYVCTDFTIKKASSRILSTKYPEARRFDIITFVAETVKSFDIVLDNIIKEHIIEYAKRL